MRRGARLAVLLLLAVGCAGESAFAQKPAEQNVTVTVVNASPQPPQPIASVRVSLGYLDTSALVTDAQQVTNSQGQALLLVSPGVAQRGNLRIAVTGAGDLVIYQPADGQLPTLPTTVGINMLPKGSPLLLGAAQIEAMLHRSLLQISSLQKQLTAQNSAAAQSQTPDLGSAIAQWAQANGFSSAEVDQQVQQWAQKIQNQSAQATNDQKALAELALKHYANAAQLFNQASNADQAQISAEKAQQQALAAQVQALQAAQQALLDKLRSPVQQLVDHSEQAAGAYQLNGQYHEATQVLESAETTAEAEYKENSGDKGFQQLWLQALSNAANALWQEGKFSPANESLPLLAQSAQDFQTLSQQYSNLGDRQSWAWEQNGLGIALLNEGARTGGDKATAIFDQAVQAFQNALQVYNKTTSPEGWAETQNSLGNALEDEGFHLTGDKALAMLAQAVQAYQNALEVATKTSAPQLWALIESNLGVALDDEGEHVTGDKAAALYDQAVQVDQQVLEVSTKAAAPRDWAETQNNIGIALMDDAHSSTGDKIDSLLDQSAQAFQNAILVFTKADQPQSWATVENNLGIVLKDEGVRATGDKATALYDQSVQAYNHALEVRTKADLPMDWADTEYNLGIVLHKYGQTATGDKGAALLNQAVAAYQNALQVYTEAYPPLNWAGSEEGLAQSLMIQALSGTGDHSTLLDQAIEAYKKSLDVITKSDDPTEWSEVHSGLAIAYNQQKSYDAAAAEYRLALETEPDAADDLQDLATIDHEDLFVFDRALTLDEHRVQLDPSPGNKMELLEAEFTAGDFDACVQQAAGLTDNVLTPGEIIVRDTLALACQWASGNKSAALSAEKSLASVAASEQKHFWTFDGTLHYLNTAPAFQKNGASWIALFTAVQNADGGGIAAALQQLAPLMQN
jgi:tetratricopeptide (TPR) repeat protein